MRNCIDINVATKISLQLIRTFHRQRKSASIETSRWSAYAIGGAASVFTGNAAQAAIHYSGLLNVPFPPQTRHTFPLDQAGDKFQLGHFTTASFSRVFDEFRVFGLVSGAFANGFYIGSTTSNDYLVRRLRLNFPINSVSGFGWNSSYKSGRMAGWNGAPWNAPGRGFIGFRFDNGAGAQYGWARIRTSGLPKADFVLVDYAYADPGEPIRTGQTSRDEPVPDQGSLGWLAIGATGLLTWRRSRSLRHTRPKRNQLQGAKSHLKATATSARAVQAMIQIGEVYYFR